VRGHAKSPGRPAAGLPVVTAGQVLSAPELIRAASLATGRTFGTSAASAEAPSVGAPDRGQDGCCLGGGVLGVADGRVDGLLDAVDEPGNAPG
jgi:hypothetical protein